MSFILEALRKSENERQRQSGPDFASIPESAEKRRSSRWPLIVGALVLLNLGLLTVVLWPAGEQPATTAAGANASSQTAHVSPSPASAEAAIETASRDGPRPLPVDNGSAPVRDTSDPPRPGNSDDQGTDEPAGTAATAPRRDVRALSEEVAPREDTGTAITQAPAARTTGSVVVAEAPLGDEPEQQGAASTPATAPDPTPPPTPEQRLPTANELRLEGFLTGPPLHLDLHVYYPEPSRRVVFISGNRYREGDRVSGGTLVREIVPEGVVLEDRGRRFILGPD